MTTAPQSPTEALKPCPFCGGNDLHIFPPTCDKDTPYDASHRAYPVARCHACYAEAAGKNWDRSGNSAIAAWNRRIHPQQPSGWISVKDRMPANCETVLAFWTPSSGRIHSGCWATATFENGRWYNPEDDEDDYAEPSFWKPVDSPLEAVPAHPVEQQEGGDAKRLDWMIAQECFVESVLTEDGQAYRVHWPDDGSWQTELFTTPRYAIDAAIAAMTGGSN